MPRYTRIQLSSIQDALAEPILCLSDMELIPLLVVYYDKWQKQKG